METTGITEQPVETVETKDERVYWRDYLIETFRASDECKKLKEIFSRLAKKDTSKLQPKMFSIYAGVVFEQMALTYYFTRIETDPEAMVLSNFVQEMLQGQNTYEVESYRPTEMPMINPDEKTTDKKGIGEKELIRQNKLLLANPDALIIKREGRMMKVVGYVEAKLNGGFRGDRKIQKERIERDLQLMVRRLKQNYSAQREMLDLQILPEEIDVADGQLKDIIINPQETIDTPYTKTMGEDKIITIPIARDEILLEVQTMVEEILRQINEKGRGQETLH